MRMVDCSLRLSWPHTGVPLNIPSILITEDIGCGRVAGNRHATLMALNILEGYDVTCMAECSRGGMPPQGDTVYFSVVDNHGNACSFMNSNFRGFGSAIVPEGCGFTLQNRGLGFSLRPDHPNVVTANKRPYHTIIPSMVTCPDTGDLELSFGIMGGYFQPQGQLQLLVNIIDSGMDPQSCLGSPRFCLASHADKGDASSLSLYLEKGFPDSVVTELRSRGHKVIYPISGYERSLFGRDQAISRGAWWERYNNSLPQTSDMTNDTVYWAGSEPRCDGLAVGY